MLLKSNCALFTYSEEGILYVKLLQVFLQFLATTSTHSAICGSSLIEGLLRNSMDGGIVKELHTLIKEVKTGNIRAYAVVVGRFQQTALAYAYSVLGDYQIAEDVVQEAFVKAFERLSQLSNPAAFPGWFRKILYTCCDRIKRRRDFSTVPLGDIGNYPSQQAKPDEIAEDNDQMDKIQSAIDMLPEAERTVVTLYYMSEYSQKEIGAFLNIPAKTVKSRLHTARQKLKQEIQILFDDLSQKDLPAQNSKKDTNMIKAIYPELGVNDVEASAKFLEEALGFKRRFPHSENGQLHFLVMSQGNASLFLHHRKQLSDATTNVTRIYFEPTDIRSLHTAVKQKGYDITDLEEHENGIVCHLAGPDGYEFWFQQWNAS